MNTLKKDFTLLARAGRWIRENGGNIEIGALKQRAGPIIEECKAYGASELFCWCLVEFPVEIRNYLWEQFYND